MRGGKQYQNSEHFQFDMTLFETQLCFQLFKFHSVCDSNIQHSNTKACFIYIKKKIEVILVSVLGQTRGQAHIYPTTIVCFRLPKDTGPGTVSETMYYLRLFSRQREPFQYGCYGNDYHFKTFIIILIVLTKAIHVGKMNTRRKGLEKSDPEKTHGISYCTCS